ncbi:hypothetical protein [Clostridium sp. Marseille-P2415]|uniref:hypothetical protein n=1 Tax=Clostridium sp. Marseille-P2415 TaxID=1805471 RepID=UPI00190ECC13|nr:hypothetical protein [Clostridium sp. Marseille-P2415]
MNKKPIIENYIEINGKDVLMDSLPEEKRREISVIIQDRMMESIGFKRVSSEYGEEELT